MSAPAATARLDDLVAHASFVFEQPGTPLVARRLADVVRVLEDVEDQARRGSWMVGFICYEAAAAFDPALSVREPSGEEPLRDLPLVWFVPFATRTSVPGLDELPDPVAQAVGPWRLDAAPRAYASKVDAVRNAIAAGDTYQCNLTVRLDAKLQGDPFALYRALALAQRGAYNTYLDTGRFVVASASPELFFDVVGTSITTRPMKGTTARGRFLEEDRARADALASSPKERAENVMIVDLLRNDLGRLARVGSVQVEQLFTLERYETVWQLTSTVHAELPPETRLSAIFRALFPCGSVTGAPKASTMRLIAALEDSARGLYCGALGVVAADKDVLRARFCVPIRTAVVDRDEHLARYGTGGGVLWDSRATSEHEELLAKAAILHGPRQPFELLETMAYEPGKGVRNRSRHLARLVASATYFGFAYDEDALARALEDALGEVASPQRVRLLLARSGAVRVEPSALEPGGGPVLLELAREPVDSSEVLRVHKTTARAPYLAAQRAHPLADDVILINERGELVETTIANLALRLDGRWCTPAISSGCLPGIERGRLLDSGALVEEVLTKDALEHQDGLAVVSSLRGWREARLREGTQR